MERLTGCLIVIALAGWFAACGRSELPSSTKFDGATVNRGKLLSISFSNNSDFIVIDGAAKTVSETCTIVPPIKRDGSTLKAWNPLQVFWVIAENNDVVDYGTTVDGVYAPDDKFDINRFQYNDGSRPVGFMQLKQKHIDAITMDQLQYHEGNTGLSVRFGSPINARIFTAAEKSDSGCRFQTYYCKLSESGCSEKDVDRSAYTKFSTIRLNMWLKIPTSIDFE